MSRPKFTAFVIVEEMPERWRMDYPVVNVQEFYDEILANNWCQNFIKAPCAGGPTEPYRVRWQVIFGVELDSGSYGRG